MNSNDPRHSQDGVHELQQSATQNRETATIDMLADLSGFLYGMHAIIGRKHFTEGMADCFDAPSWAP